LAEVSLPLRSLLLSAPPTSSKSARGNDGNTALRYKSTGHIYHTHRSRVQNFTSSTGASLEARELTSS